MRHTIRFSVLILSILASLLPGSRSASARESPPFHVRSEDPSLARLVRDGQTRSMLFRQIVARLDTSDVIAHVECAALPPEINGQVVFVFAAGDVRYVRVQLDCRLAPPVLIAMLGHELQHVVEIASTPAVVDEESLRTLYQQCGLSVTPDGRRYDSEAAQIAGVEVLREVLASPRAAATGRRAAR